MTCRQERLLKLSLGISPLPVHSTAVAQEPFHTFWAKATELDAANTSAKDKIFIACLFIVIMMPLMFLLLLTMQIYQ